MERILSDKALKVLKQSNAFEDGTDVYTIEKYADEDFTYYSLKKNGVTIFTRNENFDVLYSKEHYSRNISKISEDIYTNFAKGFYNASNYSSEGMNYEKDKSEIQYLDNGIASANEVNGHDFDYCFSSQEQRYIYDKYIMNNNLFCSSDGKIFYDVVNDKVYLNCVGAHLIDVNGDIVEQVSKCIDLQKERLEKESEEIRDLISDILRARGYDVNEYSLNSVNVEKYVSSSNLVDYSVCNRLVNIKKLYQLYINYKNKDYEIVLKEISSLNDILERTYDNQNNSKKTRKSN